MYAFQYMWTMREQKLYSKGPHKMDGKSQAAFPIYSIIQSHPNIQFQDLQYNNLQANDLITMVTQWKLV